MHRSLLLLALCAVAVALAAATPPASAATISPQAELRTPGTFPVDLPGGYRQGRRIPRGWVLLRRSIELAPGEERAAATFRCPGRTRIRTIGLNDPSDVGLIVRRSQLPYVGRRSMRIDFFPSPKAQREGRAARGRAYVLCRPAG